MTYHEELHEGPAVYTAGGAVVAAGCMEDGGDAVAVWQVDGRGRPTGAWIQSQASAFGDRDVARRLLACLDRRAITAVTPAVVGEIVGKLTVAADLDAPAEWWDRQVFTASDSVADVVQRRADVDRTLAARRESGQSVAAIGWTSNLDEVASSSDHERLRRLAGVEISAASAVAREALTVARVLHWVAGLWSETEQVKNRRPYIAQALGAVEPLPPSWARSAAAARTNSLPL